MPYKDPAAKAAAELVRYHARRVEATVILGSECVVCGTTEDLEFDHIDPAQKSFSISAMWSIGKEKYLAELEKCQLLCSTHHREKTEREARTVPHGGGTSGRHGCPCTPCRLRKNEYLKLLKRERRARGLKD